MSWKKQIKEYKKTPDALVEEQLGDQPIAEVVSDNFVKGIVDYIKLGKQYLREFAGVLNPKGQTPQENIDLLETQADHWRLQALRETYEEKEQLYKSLEKVAKLKADYIRLERFKKWAKENLVGLSEREK